MNVIQPEIDPALCTGCGDCVAVCPSTGLQIVEGKAVIVNPECSYCGECELVCPQGAISCPYEIVVAG